MHDFLRMVLNMLGSGIGLALIAIGMGALALFIIFVIYKKKKKDKKFPWKKAFVILLLVGYFAVLLYATLLRMGGVGFRGSNFHLFRAWREAWNNYSLQNWLNILLNVAMFMPLGFLLPCIIKQFQKWYLMFATGFATSLCIEIIQYTTGRGLFDVDDLFANTIGVMLGYCVIQFLVFVLKKDSRKKCIRYVVFPTVFAAVLIGIFVKYQVQEYGNLPEAPVMTANVKGIEWNLECELSRNEKTVPTYSIVPYRKEDADAFAEEFAQMMGVEFPDASYYDSSAIYQNHSTGDFLYVKYFDRSYEHTVGDVDFLLSDIEVDEACIREMLKPYKIEIPEGAEFAYEGNGRHKVTVRMVENGDALIDGTIVCYVKEGEQLQKLNNYLTTYSTYSEVVIISEEAAYQQLCSGRFYGSDWIEHSKPDIISISSCELEYRVDTKGFYQPVYVFEASMDGSDTGTIVIPAMK